jgi:hypothetical protein
MGAGGGRETGLLRIVWRKLGDDRQNQAVHFCKGRQGSASERMPMNLLIVVAVVNGAVTDERELP